MSPSFDAEALICIAVTPGKHFGNKSDLSICSDTPTEYKSNIEEYDLRMKKKVLKIKYCFKPVIKRSI